MELSEIHGGFCSEKQFLLHSCYGAFSYVVWTCITSVNCNVFGGSTQAKVHPCQGFLYFYLCLFVYGLQQLEEWSYCCCPCAGLTVMGVFLIHVLLCLDSTSGERLCEEKIRVSIIKGQQEDIEGIFAHVLQP